MEIKECYVGHYRVRPESLDPTLIAHYELNGDLKDSSGNGYDLTNAGSTTFNTLTSGKKVLSVQNTSAYLTQSFDFSGKDISIMGWVRDTASRSGYEDWTYFGLDTGTTPTYDYSGNTNVIFLNKQGPSQSNNMRLGFEAKSVMYTVNDTNRHHVAGTFNRTDAKLKMYIDTTLRGTTTNVTQTRTAGCIFIGCKGYSSTVKIEVGEFILYTKELTTAEILEHYNDTKSDYGIQ